MLETILLVIIFITGIYFGSFYTLATYRIPKGENITHKHSYCPNCNHKLGAFDLIPVFSYLFLFVFGMTLCEFFGQIISFLKRFWYVFALASLAVVFIDFDFVGTYGVLKCLFIAPAIIGFSYRYPRLSVKNDYSYGIYIYHMIVINLMIHFGLKGSFWNVLVVIVLSVLLAMISYHTIGAYSRRKRKSIS